jgi:hypothetical protein
MAQVEKAAARPSTRKLPPVRYAGKEKRGALK